MRTNILKYTIIIALLITALSNAQHRVDKRLKPYVDEYFKILDDNNIYYNTSIMLITVSQPLKGTDYLGVALGMDNENLVYVRISPRFFELDRNSRLWVMFHELSHDIFNLRHGSIKLMHKKAYDNVTSFQLSRAKSELIKHLKGL
jgi:hypothetical protein